MNGRTVRISLHVFAALAAACACPSAFAQNEEIEYARSLVRRQWFDMAEERCDKIARGEVRVSAEEKALVPLVKAEMFAEMAEKEKADVAKAKGYLDEAIKLMVGFIKGNPNHPEAMTQQSTVGFLMSRKAGIAAEKAEASEDAPDVRDALKKEAKEAYAQAEKYYEQTVADLEKQGEALKTDLDKLKGPELQERMRQIDDLGYSVMLAKIDMARSMLERARCEEGEDRKKVFAAVAKFCEAICWDHSGYYNTYEAMLIWGLAYTELGDYAKAEIKIRGVQEIHERLKEENKKPSDYHKRLIFEGDIALAKMFIRAGKFKEAVDHVDKVLKENRSVEKEWAGIQLKLEKAEALHRSGNGAAAVAVATDVQRVDPNGPAGIRAGKIIDLVTKGGGPVTPEQMMEAANTAMGRDQYPEAVGSLRRCIEVSTSEADRAKYQASAYYKMAQCLYAMERWLEAASQYEAVCSLFPNYELAAKACYEAARCYSLEFALSGDARDEAAKMKFLNLLAQRWKDDPVAGNVHYILAEAEENKKNWKKAAELYLQVKEQAEAYEQALVRAAFCLRQDVDEQWKKGAKDPAVQKAVKGLLERAEGELQKFLNRLEKVEVKNAELAKQRGNLAVVAYQQLASIYMHETIGKSKECLEFLTKAEKAMAPEDERIAKIWALKVNAHIQQDEIEPAVQIVDAMIDRYPDNPAIIDPCRRAGIKLDEITTKLEEKKNEADREKIAQNWKKVSKFYQKWLDLATAVGKPIQIQDVDSVAATLYMIAKKLNGLGEDVVSFVNLKGRTVEERQYFENAKFVYQLLAANKLPDKRKVEVMTRLARCQGFASGDDEKDWLEAKGLYDGLVKEFKLEDKDGQLEVGVLNTHKSLIYPYLELGYVYCELGKRKQEWKFQFATASRIFGNVCSVMPKASEIWWEAKYMVLVTFYERGNDADVRMAELGINNLSQNYPDFDGGKWKEKFLELKGKIAEVLGGGK